MWPNHILKYERCVSRTGFGIGHSYNGKIPFLRIDYILTNPSFEIQKFEIVNNKISDHFPVYSEIGLAKNANK